MIQGKGKKQIQRIISNSNKLEQLLNSEKVTNEDIKNCLLDLDYQIKTSIVYFEKEIRAKENLVSLEEYINWTTKGTK